jgi:hypothetical protein
MPKDSIIFNIANIIAFYFHFQVIYFFCVQALDLHVLILYPNIIDQSFISFERSFVASLGFFICEIVSSEQG